MAHRRSLSEQRSTQYTATRNEQNRVLQRQTSLAPRDASTMSLLRALHPAASQPLPSVPDTAPRMLAVESKTVRNIIHTHCNNTAAGDSATGWRNKHLIPLLDSVKCMQGIGALLIDICNGVFDGAAKQALTACTLLPLSKPDGGVRPIGIGNTFVRLAKIFAVKAAALDYNVLFPSIQLGVGHKNGCERVLHTLNAFHKTASTGHVICSTDIKNAFNTRRRIDMWQSLVSQPSCHPLIRIVHWAYSDSSKLCVYEGSGLFDTVVSAEGVVQGDPLASLLFALSMQPIYEACIAGTDVKGLAIQDDFYLMGEVKQVAVCAQKLNTLCADTGLTLAVNKCSVLPCFSNVTETNDHIQRIEEICRNVNLKVSGEIYPLGSVITNFEDGVGDHVMKMVTQQEKYFDLLCDAYMPPQLAYKLLRDCANPSMNYVTRVIRADLISDALIKWDDMSFDAFFKMHNIDVESLGEATCAAARQQAQLPLSCGGMGITSIHQSAHAAYMASLLTAHNDINKLQQYVNQMSNNSNTESDEEEKKDNDNTDETSASDFATIHYKSNTVLSIQYMNERKVDVLEVTKVPSIDQLCNTPTLHHKLQHKLVEKMHVYALSQLKSSVSPSHRAVLLSASQTGAARWLINMFDSGDKLFKPALWNAAIRHRLYIRPCDVMCSDVCVCAKSSTITRAVQPFSVQPAHFHVCDMMKGQLKQRHDLVKITLYRLLSELGAHVTVEPHLARSAVQSLRADLLVVTASGSKYIDVSVVCPAGHEFVTVYRSDKHAGRACEEAAREKVIKYTGAMPSGSSDADFVPLVFETYGAVNRGGMSWLKAVCSELSDEPASSLTHILNVLSATLQMGNGQVDIQGMALHRRSHADIEQSQNVEHQSNVMSLLQQYVHGGIRIDWLTQQRQRPVRGSMREAIN